MSRFASSGVAKGRCGRLDATYSLPVHQEGFSEPLPPMKSRHLGFATCFAVLLQLPLRSQDSPRLIIAGAAIPDPLAVAEFVPPAPAPQKEVPNIKVDATTTIPLKNGKTLTILRGEPSTLPDIPLPLKRQPVIKHLPTEEDLAREKYRRHHSIMLGATVYDHKVSIIRWQHPDTGVSYEALCGFDVGLLAGIGRFIRDGETYNLMLMHSEIDTTRARKNGARGFPDLSHVADNSIRFVRGESGDAVGTAPVRLVKELIVNEKIRLQTFQADLGRHREARAAWEKANPPVPRDETIWIRPHRGSRYLMDTTSGANAR